MASRSLSYAQNPVPSADPPLIVFVIHEKEYNTRETLPAFASKFLEVERGYRCAFLQGDGPNNIPGLTALRDADLLVLSVRRQPLPPDQLRAIRDYLDSGRPLVAIRTSSHAFVLRSNESLPQGTESWPEFDHEVLGGNYRDHHPNPGDGVPRARVWTLDSAAAHPILRGVPSEEFEVASSLYKTSPLVPRATPLMMGRFPGSTPDEPVAWTHEYKGARVFYTSLGHPGDFEIEAFRRLLLNGIEWALGQLPKSP